MTNRACDARPSRRSGLMTLCARVLVAATLAVGVTACSAPEVQTRGNIPTAKKIAEIEPGSTTRPQVESLLGTPSTTSLFDNGETWFYMGAYTQQYAYHATEELERHILAVSFDQNGVVSQIKALNKDDGSEMTLVERKTPTAGNELTLMEQLLGNVGRFSNENTGGKGVTRK